MGEVIVKVGNIVDDSMLNKADAIVCPTNPMMKMGSGVCGAIFQKAGVKELEEYTEQKFGLFYGEGGMANKMMPTEIRIAPGFNIPCDIIFAQGVKAWLYPTEQEAMSLFVQTYEKILDCISQRQYRYVLMPALGTGHYGFTHEQTAQIVMETLEEYVKCHEVTISFVVVDEQTAEFYRER